MRFSSNIGLLSLLGAVSLPLSEGRPASSSAPSHSLSAKTVWQASANYTWIENLAVRSSNGNILYSLITEPSVWQLEDPLGDANGKLLYEFPEATSCLGITEIGQDVFAVVVGNLSLTTITGTQGSYSLWKVDFNDEQGKGNASPAVSKITDIPEAIFLNGITVDGFDVPYTRAEDFSGAEELATVLIADSALGTVWKVNTNNGDYTRTITVPEMSAPANASIALGINGLSLYGGSLYWTNLAYEAVYSVAVDPSTWSALPYASVRTVAGDTGVALDDFTFDSNGNIFAAGGDTVVLISDAGDSSKSNIKPVVVAGSTTTMTVAGSTSVRFGGDVLYVTTDGGMAAPVNGTVIEPGKIVALTWKY